MPWILQRIAGACLTLLVTSGLLFFLIHEIPASPSITVLGAEATQEQLAEFDHDHGLDLPIGEQYVRWLVSAVHGDFGRSYITNLPVSGQITQTLPITTEIVTVGFVFAILTALPLGIVSAFKQGSTTDHLLRVLSVIGLSVPGFWLGLLLIEFVAVQLGWFPPGGYVPPDRGLLAHLRSIALPSFVLGFYYVAILSRMTRASMTEVLGQDYVRTARAMGLPGRWIAIYAVKNGLAPVVGLAALCYGYMFGWALIVEQVFNIAGISRALLSAIFARDYVTVQAIVIVITSIFIMANFVADVLYRLLNPRIAGAGR